MRQAAFALYLLFVASWFLHLTARLPVLGTLRIDLVLVVAITLLIVASPRPPLPAVVDRRTPRVLSVFAVYVVVSLPFVQWPGSVLWFGIPAFVKAVVFYLFTAQLVTDERRLRWLLLVFVGSQTFRVVEPVYLHVTQGYWGSFASMADWQTMNRLSGAPYDVVNPNGLAFVVLTIFPLWHYLAPVNVLGVALYLTVLPVSLYCLSLTGSRSGMLGFVVVLVVIWVRSRRKVLLAGCTAIALVVALPYLSDDLRDRYLSTFSANTRNAASAQGRLRGVQSDFAVALRRPAFGHGLGTSLEANANFSGEALPSHNLYTETAQEVGFVGLAIFAYLLLSIIRNVRGALTNIRRTHRASRLLTRLANALEVLLAMNLLFSFASYGLSGYEWYFLAGLSETVRGLTQANAAEAGTGGNAVVGVSRAAVADQQPGNKRIGVRCPLNAARAE